MIYYHLILVCNEHAYPRYRRRPPAPDDRAVARDPEKYERHFEYNDSGGPDVRQKVDYDEFNQIRLARYITSMEAILSLWGTKLVDKLDVHGPSGHRIAVEQGFEDEDKNMNAICEAAQAEEERKQRGEERVTQLTAYFAFNEANTPIGLSYANCYKIAKVLPAKDHFAQQPRTLAIRLLLLVVPDPKGWESLRTVNGNVFPTFVAAANDRGLLTDEDLWMKTIGDAFRIKKSIRQRIRWLAMFFATANLASPCKILDKILVTADKWLLKTSVAKASPEEQKQYVLHAMEWFLLANGITPDSGPREDGTYESACEHIGLPRPRGLVLTKETFMKLAFFRDDALNEHLHEDFLPDGQRRGAMRLDYYQKYVSGLKPNEEQQKLIDDVHAALEHVQQVIDGQCPTFCQTSSDSSWSPVKLEQAKHLQDHCSRQVRWHQRAEQHGKPRQAAFNDGSTKPFCADR
ncbi:hypothetical protein niasHT_028612 [Heterodera trifolii]|uniref:Uncharacterized protein n=1 Tax=Heterodera trifolii TaxID=157864 RepID=A0ABD2K5H2_9BILA